MIVHIHQITILQKYDINSMQYEHKSIFKVHPILAFINIVVNSFISCVTLNFVTMEGFKAESNRLQLI